GLPQAWLLVGWLATCLDWRPSGGHAQRGKELAWSFQSAHGPVDVRIQRLSEGDPEGRQATIRWNAHGAPCEVVFSATGGGRLSATGQGDCTQPRTLAAPVKSRAHLVAMQLQDLEHDAVFRAALGVAREMAESLAC